MRYIRESEQYVTVPDGYEQTFVNPNFATVSKNAVMKLKENGMIDNDDIEIVLFVYNMTVVTKEQVERYCKHRGIENGADRLDSLCQSACLNKFFLTTEPKYRGTMPADIMYFYCLQTGGTYLLKQFKCMDMLEWGQGDNLMCSRLVGKYVLSTEMYLEMLTAPKALIVYNKSPFYVFPNYTLRAGAIYGFRASSGAMDYLQTDVIRSSEDILDVREKLRRYESLVTTKYWKRYYNDADNVPYLLLVTDNDDTAYSLAKEITTGTHIHKFLISTDERILRGVRSEGSVLEYDENNKVLFETRCPFFVEE